MSISCDLYFIQYGVKYLAVITCQSCLFCIVVDEPYTQEELHTLVCPEIMEVNFTAQETSSSKLMSFFRRAVRYRPSSTTRKLEVRAMLSARS